MAQLAINIYSVFKDFRSLVGRVLILMNLLTFCMLGNCLSADFFFQKLTVSKYSIRVIIRVAHSLDQDQARRFDGPNLDTNCLQMLSADDTGS